MINPKTPNNLKDDNLSKIKRLALESLDEFNKEKKTEDGKNLIEIIKQELLRFSRDTGFSLKGKMYYKIQLFYQLFCQHHKNTVWFHQGKLYKIVFSERLRSELDIPIDIYNLTEEKISTLSEKSDDFCLSYGWIWVIIYALIVFYIIESKINIGLRDYEVALIAILITWILNRTKYFYYKLRLLINK